MTGPSVQLRRRDSRALSVGKGGGGAAAASGALFAGRVSLSAHARASRFTFGGEEKTHGSAFLRWF